MYVSSVVISRRDCKPPYLVYKRRFAYAIRSALLLAKLAYSLYTHPVENENALDLAGLGVSDNALIAVKRTAGFALVLTMANFIPFPWTVKTSRPFAFFGDCSTLVSTSRPVENQRIERKGVNDLLPGCTRFR